MAGLVVILRCAEWSRGGLEADKARETKKRVDRKEEQIGEMRQGNILRLEPSRHLDELSYRDDAT